MVTFKSLLFYSIRTRFELTTMPHLFVHVPSRCVVFSLDWLKYCLDFWRLLFRLRKKEGPANTQSKVAFYWVLWVVFSSETSAIWKFYVFSSAFKYLLQNVRYFKNTENKRIKNNKLERKTLQVMKKVENHFDFQPKVIACVMTGF